MSSFGEKLIETFSRSGNLCVGLDPHPKILESWNLGNTVAGLREFGDRVLDAVAGNSGIIKPQVSFYESFGSGGFKVLEDLLQRASSLGLLVIADAKRGDIGTTMDGYYQAWLSEAAPFLCDALTLSPYLGFGSLEVVIEKANQNNKGVFVLVATSNKEAVEIQLARTATGSVAKSIYSHLEEINLRLHPSLSLGSAGAVLGATLDLGDFGIEKDVSSHVPILAPGFGAQGAMLSDAKRLYALLSPQVIYNVSRSVLSMEPRLVANAISEASAELAASLDGKS